MEIVRFFIDFIIHLDIHLTQIVNQFGLYAYAILFIIVFIETGLVFFPFCPAIHSFLPPAPYRLLDH